MSKFYKAGLFLREATILSGKAVAGATKLTGNALRGASDFVQEHQADIAAGTSKLVSGTGALIKGTGRVVESGATALAKNLHNAAEKNPNQSQKAIVHVAGFLADTTGLIGKATAAAGSATQKSSTYLGGATGAAVTGAVCSVSNVVDNVAITESDFERLRKRLAKASTHLQQRSEMLDCEIKLAQKMRRKKDLLDLLVVGGISLSAMLEDPSKVPPEVERAFELAYPDMASHGGTFIREVSKLSADSLPGVVNAVKGKMFEIELCEHLNAGNLPDGLHADLAHSATQPGYDILITDQHGDVVDLLQAKATESVTYVHQALQQYPDIDITTTSEVYGQLLALGAAGRVHDSGISDQVLQSKVEAAASAVNHASIGDLAPSSIGLAILALSSFMDKSLSLEYRAIDFGGRTGKSTVSGGLGKAALIATNTWWLGLAVGVGSRWLMTKGGNKRERFESLKKAVEMAERKAGGKISLPGTSVIRSHPG